MKAENVFSTMMIQEFLKPIIKSSFAGDPMFADLWVEKVAALLGPKIFTVLPKLSHSQDSLSNIQKYKGLRDAGNAGTINKKL